MIISCLSALTQIRFYRDNYPDQDIPTAYMGTDMCENFFGMLGSCTNANRMVYSAYDVEHMVPALMVTTHMETTGSIPIARHRESCRKGAWNGKDNIQTDPNIYKAKNAPTDEKINTLYHKTIIPAVKKDMAPTFTRIRLC